MMICPNIRHFGPGASAGLITVGLLIGPTWVARTITLGRCTACALDTLYDPSILDYSLVGVARDGERR